MIFKRQHYLLGYKSRYQPRQEHSMTFSTKEQLLVWFDIFDRAHRVTGVARVMTYEAQEILDLDDLRDEFTTMKEADNEQNDG